MAFFSPRHSILLCPRSEEEADSNEQVKEQQKKALDEYPTAFDYDGVYDKMKEKVARPLIQDHEERVRCSSLASFYCIHSLVKKVNQLCSEILTHEADEWKQWQGEPEPSKKLMNLLLCLVFLVDIQGHAQLDETVVDYQVTSRIKMHGTQCSRCTEHSVE
ncbi:nuclear speckle splicing regulatory protein [Trifolium repens]|nr:nuclear speckle splicing regulatory protein [Trifolium repens]